MTSYIFGILIFIFTPFSEIFLLNFIGLSVLLLLWELYFSKNETVFSKIILIVLCLIMDTSLKYYLGSYLLAIFLYEILKNLLSKFLSDKDGVVGIFVKGFSIFFYYVVLNFMKSFKTDSVVSSNAIIAIIISTLITYFLIELLHGRFIFNKARGLK